jgi:membrane-bound lytic murein transglycosylase MltF
VPTVLSSVSLLCVPQGDPWYEKVSPSLVEPKKGKKRPRFLDQFAGYEKAIRGQESLNDYTIIKVLATQTNMPKAMLKEQYMKDIEVLHREGDKFVFTGNYLIVTADSLTLPTPS